MGSMIGPITLTVGQPYKVQLAQDTAYIELQNDSLYDVWVYFGEVEPTDTTNANNTWHRVVRRQHNGVLPVEGYRGASAAERRNNTIGAFRGTVWLLSVNPGGLASTGNISGRSQVYLTPYAQGDSLPAHSSLSTQTDLTSQPRVIAVPVASTQSYVQACSYTAVGQSVNLGVGPRPAITVGTWDGNTPLVVYLYALALSVSDAASTVLKLQVCERDGSFVLGNVYDLHVAAWADTGTGMPQGPHVFCPATPFPLVFKPAVTTRYIVAQVTLVSTGFTFGTLSVYANCAIDVDQVNHQVNPPIGGGSPLYNLAGVANGPVY